MLLRPIHLMKMSRFQIVSKRRYTSKQHIKNVKFLALKSSTSMTSAPCYASIRLASSYVNVARQLLKIRYILGGATVGCSVIAYQKYYEIKDKMSKMDWLSTSWSNLRDRINEKKNKFSWPDRSGGQTRDNWFSIKWLKAIFEESESESDYDLLPGVTSKLKTHLTSSDQILTQSPSNDSTSKPVLNEQLARKVKEIEEIKLDMLHSQTKYQKEVARLERENAELRRRLLQQRATSDSKRSGGRKRSVKKSLIDMYSEVLDELADYDTAYNVQDHLPRVVVVGDQSSGKTSVLEMIAQARIFPRGSGEMMTRSPVKVTLSEGPYHVATFRGDSLKEYDLSKDADLEALRTEIEFRMRNSVKEGETISAEPISLSVKGPGLPRMVLVDLPGVISTVTTSMASNTRESIKSLCMQQMENPNSIILCIQDGSLDAERSLVTDLVSAVDPKGKRTIFVLTKVDLAEKTILNPDRIKQILEGKLFPMKALGYFAVVTGTGDPNNSIQEIKDFEENFFSKSQLFKAGFLKPDQMTTKNMSMAVSECFWKMVKHSIVHQTDEFRAAKFNLETDWKNTFSKYRELDREELFDKARGETLDEVINLSQISAQEWEKKFLARLSVALSPHLINEIYIPSAASIGQFNTAVDISLRKWVEKRLPLQSVQVGKQTLLDEFSSFLLQHRQTSSSSSSSSSSCNRPASSGGDEIFDKIKEAVIRECATRHHWDHKAIDMLKVMQLNVMQDRAVPDKAAWNSAIVFMENLVNTKLTEAKADLSKLVGPDSWSRWTQWLYQTELEHQRRAACDQLRKLLQTNPLHTKQLLTDELTTVRKNLEADNVKVSNAVILETWNSLYKVHFLEKSFKTAKKCEKGYHHYREGITDSDMDCSDVVLFWRMDRMLSTTANALRQQLVNSEAQRLERNIKEILTEISQDDKRLGELLTGKRVHLAEELKKVRCILEKLEEFMAALSSER